MFEPRPFPQEDAEGAQNRKREDLPSAVLSPKMTFSRVLVCTKPGQKRKDAKMREDSPRNSLRIFASFASLRLVCLRLGRAGISASSCSSFRNLR
jgi:hypothetical protein